MHEERIGGTKEKVKKQRQKKHVRVPIVNTSPVPREESTNSYAATAEAQEIARKAVTTKGKRTG